jgi:hypothetical protein
VTAPVSLGMEKRSGVEVGVVSRNHSRPLGGRIGSSQGADEFRVAGRSTNVFGGAGALSGFTAGDGPSILRRKQRVDAYRVLPSVIEVVAVRQTITFGDEGYASFVVDIVVETPEAVPGAGDLPQVQMYVLPLHL